MNQTQQPVTSIYLDQTFVDVAYAFSPYQSRQLGMHTPHVFLDILFMHPRTSEPVSLRVTAQAYLLCQPKEIVEAAVHEEIRNALHFPGAEAYLFEAAMA